MGGATEEARGTCAQLESSVEHCAGCAVRALSEAAAIIEGLFSQRRDRELRARADEKGDRRRQGCAVLIEDLGDARNASLRGGRRRSAAVRRGPLLRSRNKLQRCRHTTFVSGMRRGATCPPGLVVVVPCENFPINPTALARLVIVVVAIGRRHSGHFQQTGSTRDRIACGRGMRRVQRQPLPQNYDVVVKVRQSQFRRNAATAGAGELRAL